MECRRIRTGFTLIEALGCLAILGILASLAAPPFRAALTRQRIAAVRTELTASIQWARWEALRRNTWRRTDPGRSAAVPLAA